MKTQPKQQTIFQYIAFGPTASEANSILQQYGMPVAQSRTQLADSLAAVFSVNPNILKDLARIHPDREMIEEVFQEENQRKAPPMNASGNYANCSGCGGVHMNCSGCGGAHMNCSGCGGTCGGNKPQQSFSADGEGNSKNNTAQMMAQNNMLAVGFVLALFGVLVIALKSNKP